MQGENVTLKEPFHQLMACVRRMLMLTRPRNMDSLMLGVPDNEQATLGISSVEGDSDADQHSEQVHIPRRAHLQACTLSCSARGTSHLVLECTVSSEHTLMQSPAIAHSIHVSHQRTCGT